VDLLYEKDWCYAIKTKSALASVFLWIPIRLSGHWPVSPKAIMRPSRGLLLPRRLVSKL